MPTVAETAPKFRAKLQALLEAKGMSQSDLARRATEIAGYEIPSQSINRYTAGASPRPETSRAIAEALGVDGIWLFNESDDSPPKRPGASLTGAQLEAACADRYFTYARVLADMLDQAERIEWEKIGDLITNNPQNTLSTSVHRAMLLVDRLLAVLRHALEPFHAMADRGQIERPDRAALQLVELDARFWSIMKRVTSSERVKKTLAAWMRAGVEEGYEDPDQAIASARKALDDYFAATPPRVLGEPPSQKKKRSTRRKR